MDYLDYRPNLQVLRGSFRLLSTKMMSPGVQAAPQTFVIDYSSFQMSLRCFASFLAALLFLTVPGAVCAQPSAHPEAARAENGMVVSAQIDASEAGVEILKQGGNAIDAAVATGFALAVTYPVAGNVGGGGFMVIRRADGSTTTFDYRETAPAAAHRDMYLDEDGNAVAAWSRRGHLASGVPGAVAGMLKAHDQHGSLPLEVVLEPAIRLAADGYVLSRRQATLLNNFRTRFLEFESTAKYFTKQDPADQYQEGEIFRQEDLANVLRRIRDHGRDGFYTGETADLIVAEMERGGGIITHQDLAAYEAVEREPVVSSYRGHRVISMAPPSSGGVAVAQLLNAMEPYNIADMGHNSSATLHVMGEAMRRVYADRAEWLGDPDFFEVPVAELIDKEYMQRRMADFRPWQADSSVAIDYGNPLALESTETTHYSVVDREGNAVSVTTTINGSFGSYVVVDGAGFFLNNEMDDFSAKPGVPNMFGLVGNEANAIEPGKRMLSSMTPTIVEDETGNLKLVIGTPGGATIITTVFQVIMNVIDHEMNIQQAVAAGRMHHQWLPDEMRFERAALQRDVVDNLLGRGWNVVERGVWGRADGIIVECEGELTSGDPSSLETITARQEGCVYYGGADPRGEDVAVGY
jgi:gamma-glutamyltranspeptidase / glutathione hydrolase